MEDCVNPVVLSLVVCYYMFSDVLSGRYINMMCEAEYQPFAIQSSHNALCSAYSFLLHLR